MVKNTYIFSLLPEITVIIGTLRLISRRFYIFEFRKKHELPLQDMKICDQEGNLIFLPLSPPPLLPHPPSIPELSGVHFSFN